MTYYARCHQNPRKKPPVLGRPYSRPSLASSPLIAFSVDFCSAAVVCADCPKVGKVLTSQSEEATAAYRALPRVGSCCAKQPGAALFVSYRARRSSVLAGTWLAHGSVDVYCRKELREERVRSTTQNKQAPVPKHTLRVPAQATSEPPHYVRKYARPILDLLR